MWKEFVKFAKSRFRRTGRSATAASSNDSSRASSAPRTVTGGIKQLVEEGAAGPHAYQSMTKSDWTKMLESIWNAPYKGQWAYLGGKWYKKTGAGEWVCQEGGPVCQEKAEDDQ